MRRVEALRKTVSKGLWESDSKEETLRNTRLERTGIVQIIHVSPFELQPVNASADSVLFVLRCPVMFDSLRPHGL